MHSTSEPPCLTCLLPAQHEITRKGLLTEVALGRARMAKCAGGGLTQAEEGAVRARLRAQFEAEERANA